MKRVFKILIIFFIMPFILQAQTRGLSVVSRDKSTGNIEEVKLYNKTYAVIIGIDKYKNLPRSRQLSFAVSDAKAVESVLRRSYRFDKIMTLYNEQATRDNIMKLLTSDLPETIGEEDSLFIFWAGHGNQVKTKDGELGYLIPYDGNMSGIYGNITMSQIKDDISKAIQAKHIFYAMDSCYSGLLTTRSVGASYRHDPSYLKEITKERVRQVLTAGSKDQEVLDGGPGGHSVFTGRLIEILQATGDYITANEIQAILREKVYQDAQARGHDQTPGYGTLYGIGDYVFIPSVEQKVVDNQNELDKIQKELAEISALEAEAKKSSDAIKLKEAERQKKILEAKMKAEELKKQQLSEDQARLAGEEKRKAQLESQKKEEEKKISELKAELERKRKSLQTKPTGEKTIDDAVREIKELSSQIASTEAQMEKELASARARIKSNYDEKVRSIDAQKKDEFETAETFNARVKKELADAKSERDRELSKLDGLLDNQLKPLKDEIRSIAEKEYSVPGQDVTVELGQYNPAEEYFPVTVRINQQGASKTTKDKQPGMKGKVYVPKDQARAFKQNYGSGVALPELKAVPKNNMYALSGGIINDAAAGAKYDIDFGMIGRKFTSPTLGAKFVLVPAGNFIMEQHSVKISRPFYVQTTEVTQGQWKRVMGTNPSYFKDCGDACPVEQVSWNDVQKFIKKLNSLEGSSRYRLPTEAEWEYSCRSGGSSEEYPGGSDINTLGWIYTNSDNMTHPAAQKKPNSLGLFDMGGNVWEWCSDWYGPYPDGNVTDPAGPDQGYYKVFRGGSWRNRGKYATASYRYYYDPDTFYYDIGFRLVADAEKPAAKK